MNRDERPTWSKSQVANLTECSRKFLLSARGAASVDAAALKKIKNRYLWAGGLVHDAVGTLLKTIRQGAPVAGNEEFIGTVRERMRAEFKSSREGAEGAQLFEHLYRVPVEAAAWQRQWESVEKSLRWFLGSKWLERLKALGPECWKAVDEILDFDVDGIKAYVKIDCAVEIDGKTFLIDWKTSSLRASDEASLQVAALYAHEVWTAAPEATEAFAVSLVDGKSSKAAITEDSLMETFMRIQEESALLQERLAAGVDPLSLPPAAPAVCGRCNFQKICHPNGVRLEEACAV